MTLAEMKESVYSMIEEYDENSETFTSDDDLANKMNSVINQIMFELARVKKISKYKSMEVEKDEMIYLKDIDENIYQLHKIKGVEHEIIDETIIFNEKGIAKIFYYSYPQKIDEDTDDDDYKFELSDDALECMPYGVAGDLLSSDVSNQYGNVYKTRYQELKNQLDPRYSLSNMRIVGGIDF